MKYYIVDAFTKVPFKGNPAGVCLLDDWIEDSLMQKIAFENNLSETAFTVKREGGYELRWFTPKVEVDLCGHATLATAHVLMNLESKNICKVDFRTRSGILSVRKENDILILNFPSRKPVPCAMPPLLEKALGVTPVETHMSEDMLILLENESDVSKLSPNFELLKEIDNTRGFIVTARGDQCDFVSRFFAPGVGINEDPVTGSSHTILIPFWSQRFNKAVMNARQISQRGGELMCRDCGDRVEIGGCATAYLSGDILI